MSITPDTQDWTWVLERPCQKRGFAPSARSLAGDEFTVETVGLYHLHDVGAV